MTEKKSAEQEAEDFAAARETRKKTDLGSITELFKSSEYLTAWETTFLSSIRGQLQRDRDLSDKHRAILDKTIAKVAERYD